MSLFSVLDYVKTGGENVELFNLDPQDFYEFGGKVYVQSDGGPIGLSLSGAIGRTTMAVWDREVVKLCRVNRIVMKMRRRYVDDCNGAMEGWRKGWRWHPGSD